MLKSPLPPPTPPAHRVLRKGDTLETFGTGRFTQGYFGGITLAPPARAGVDAATGLIYVGNGQYYDPETGRFLTRDARPNQNNPYTPIDPTGALLGPLALLALAYGRKKSRGKRDMLVILLVLGLSLGMGLAACEPGTYNYETETATAIATVTPSPTETATVAITVTPKSPETKETPDIMPTLDCTATLTPENTSTLPVPTPINEKRFYDIYNALMDSLYKDHWWREMDDGTEMILAVLGYLELRSIRINVDAIAAGSEAIANRYRFVCPNNCLIVNGEIPDGLQWTMRFSHSLMQIQHGVSEDLRISSIDHGFAVKIGQDVVRISRMYNADRPFGFFNPQSVPELDYFVGRRTFLGDTSRKHLYWWAPDKKEYANPMDIWITLTHNQNSYHCTKENPEYFTAKIRCGN